MSRKEIEDVLKGIGINWERKINKSTKYIINEKEFLREISNEVLEKNKDDKKHFLKNWEEKLHPEQNRRIGEIFQRYFKESGHLKIADRKIFFEKMGILIPEGIPQIFLNEVEITFKKYSYTNFVKMEILFSAENLLQKAQENEKDIEKLLGEGFQVLKIENLFEADKGIKKIEQEIVYRMEDLVAEIIFIAYEKIKDMIMEQVLLVLFSQTQK